MIYLKTGYEAYLPNPDWDKTQSIFKDIVSCINDDYELSSDLLALNDIIEFKLNDMGKSIYIDALKDPIKIDFNPDDDSPGIRIESSAEIFHLYWCHQLNLMAAMAAKKIQITGSLQKVMGLGQVVSGTRKIYVRLFEEIKSR